MGIPEISAALAGTTHAIKLVAGVLKTARDVEVKEAVTALQDNIIDLQSKIFAIHSKYEELAEIKRQAEEKLVAYEQWDTQAARYRLHEPAPGMFVYALQPQHQAGEPSHWLCPHCFQQRKRSILSREHVDYLNYKCQGCGFDICPTSPGHGFSVMDNG